MPIVGEVLMISCGDSHLNGRLGGALSPAKPSLTASGRPCRIARRSDVRSIGRASLAIVEAAAALTVEDIGPASAEAVQAKIENKRFIDSLGG
jgi:hypothetical protein